MSKSLITLPQINSPLISTLAPGETQMDKTSIICKLHAVADYCLHGSGGWPSRGEALPTVSRIIEDLGLFEDVPGSSGTTRATPLGKEMSVELMMVFFGCWELYEVPGILEQHGYIDSLERHDLYELPDPEFEQSLHFVVYRAYRDFCSRSKWLN
jgi:hypothetical protein